MITQFLHRLYGMVAIACLLLLVGLAGCNDDSVDGFLQFSNDNLLLKAAGDTVVIDVTAGADWKAESQADWCTVEESEAGKLIIRVSPSDDVYERGTAVKVTCGDNVVRLAVRQEPMVFEISDGKKTLDFDKRVATDVLKIHTNMSWKVEIADTTGWLQVADTMGTGDSELVFTASDNSQEKGRITTVRLRYGIRTLKLTASQEGGIRADGHIQKHYGEREVDKGFNLIFLGEGFIDKDLVAETGVFDQAVEEAYEALFEVEPYKTYKEYFNVYSIACESRERGASTIGEKLKNTAFATVYDPERSFYSVLSSRVWNYSEKILGMTADILKTNSVVVLLVNDERYGGNTYWIADGRTLSVVPLNRDTQLPGGFTNLFLHEVGGHGIGKLADEWSENTLLTASDKAIIQTRMNALYCYNLGVPRTPALAAYPKYMWSVWEAKPEYEGVLKLCDGGYGCVSDEEGGFYVFHCEEKSCMLNHLPYFNAASRYAIVQWVLFKVGEFPFSGSGQQQLFSYFIEHDSFEIPADQPVSDRPQLSMPVWREVDEAD